MKLQGRPCKFYMTVFLVNYICLTATPSRPGQERPNPLVSLVRSRLSSSVKRGDACLGVVARLGRDRTCKGGGHSTSQGEFSGGSPRRSSGRRAWGRGGLDVSRCAFVCTCLKPRPPLSKKVALRGGTQTGLRQGPSWKCERCTPAPAGTSAVHASTAPGDAPQPADPRTRAKDSQPPRGKRHLGPSRVPVLLFLFDLQRRFWPFCAAGGARTEDPSSR